MNKITDIQEGKYRLLVIAVDQARSVLAVAKSKTNKEHSMTNGIKEWDAMCGLNVAQGNLEQHVERHGVPKLGHRV